MNFNISLQRNLGKNLASTAIVGLEKIGLRVEHQKDEYLSLIDNSWNKICNNLNGSYKIIFYHPFNKPMATRGLLDDQENSQLRKFLVFLLNLVEFEIYLEPFFTMSFYFLIGGFYFSKTNSEI